MIGGFSYEVSRIIVGNPLVKAVWPVQARWVVDNNRRPPIVAHSAWGLILPAEIGEKPPLPYARPRVQLPEPSLIGEPEECLLMRDEDQNEPNRWIAYPLELRTGDYLGACCLLDNLVIRLSDTEAKELLAIN